MAISKSVLWKKKFKWILHHVEFSFSFTDKHYSQHRPRNWARSLWRGASNAGHKSYWLCCGGNLHGNFFFGGGGNLYFIISFFMSTAEVCIVLYRNMKIYFIHWRLSSSPKKISFMQRKAIVLVIFCPVLK